MSTTEYPKILLCAVIISIAPIACQVSTQLPGEQKTEIVFVATHHATLLLNPDFSPAHLRALLSKIDPAAISVEKLPDWRERGYSFTFPQEWYATYTWVEEKGIPIYGVDWDGSAEDKEEVEASVGPPDTSTVEQRWEELQTRLTGLGKWEASQAFGESNEASQAFGESNSIESFQRNELTRETDQAWFLQLPSDERAFLDIRDDHITENILKVAREYPGKRIAVVYGDFHCPRISKRLRNQTEISIVSTFQLFPLTTEEITSGWYKDDAVLLLGANLDSWVIPGVPQARDHRRTKELLNKLELLKPESSATRYYQAKWRLLFGDLEGAEKILNEIVPRKTYTAIPHFPDHRWCWPPLRTFEQKAL
ncbi:MAG: hypothetical protein ACYS80_25820, partial [Planctomycetota bacterium]